MNDECIRLDTTIIAIDNLINEAATGTMARTLFKAKDTIYNQQRYVIDLQPVKHGRWITWDDSGFTKCSCCNSEYYIADLQTVGDSEGFVNFCPNCGARMDGGK